LKHRAGAAIVRAVRHAAVIVAFVGCAQGSSRLGGDGPPPPDQMPADAHVVEPQPDARVFHDAHVFMDAQPIDAKVFHDAPPIDACVPITSELLANPAFDLTPMGTLWTAQPIDSAYPIITADNGIAAQSAPYKAWMGGWAGTDKSTTSLTDLLYQDVAVPAHTTQLVLTGYYAVATGETGTTVFDTGNLDLIQTNGTPIEAVLALTNATSAASFTALSHTFSTDVSGQTVRLRFTTTNDITNATSFYFDTMSLKATHCP
jgi:hypothetical protein